jgi:hypothetical protein
MSEATDQRIIVLGSKGHAGVTSYDWGELPVGLSIADFNVVILNFAALEEPESLVSLNLENLPKREQIARLLFSPNSEVVVLGSPDLQLRDTVGREFSPTWWLPFHLDVTREYGSEIKISDPSFSYYFPHVSRWTAFVRERLQLNMDPAMYALTVTQEGRSTNYNFKPLATTRFNEAVAFSIQMEIVDKNRNLMKYSGPVFWLPRADLVTAYDAAELILKARYKVMVATEAPAWAELFTLPRQDEVRRQIDDLNAQILELDELLHSAHERLKRESRFGALLFERGDILEELVRDAFRELGATVEERPKDREDGRFITPSGDRGIIEVKGRTGPAKLSDIRQLNHWVGDAIADEDWEGKGVLVVNAFAEKAIDERADAFPANSVRAAERFEQCLMTTTQLFAAIRSQQQGSFDADAFWATIFATSGVCKLPDL